MRENKFRVWCEFLVDGELHTSMESSAGYFLIDQKGALWSYEPLHAPRLVGDEHKNVVPLFYTGQKDKNDQEIYEGDVIIGLHDYGPGGFHSLVGGVEFSHEHGYGWSYWDVSTLEVIGNIYENPELLKGDKNGQIS